MLIEKGILVTFDNDMSIEKQNEIAEAIMMLRGVIDAKVLIPSSIDKCKITPKPLRLLQSIANNDLYVKEIADKLNITHWTAKNQLHSIKETLGVKTGHAAIVKALKQGSISLE